jgi:hypothetical protein
MIAPLMLFEDVPLIATAKLGSFFDSSLIGHYYGDLTSSRVRCIKIDPMTYLVSAHPWQQITACFVADKRTDGFEAFVRTDTDGETRQYIRFTAPPADDNATVFVAGKAKQSPISGKLLENPDEIIEDIARLCGRVLNFPLFREACNRRGLRIGGSVDEARSLRSYVSEIIQSCGALWLGDNALFYPGEPLGYAMPAPSLSSVSQEVSMTDVAGSLGVWYGWNQAQQRNGGYIELKAIGCQYDNKGIYHAKWLRLARDAEELARRILAKRAGYFVTTKGNAPGIIRAGQVLDVQNENFNGPMLVTKAQPSEVETAIEGEVIVSTFTNMKVVEFSTENQSQRSERIDALLDLVKGEATITVFDSQNRPMPDIFVTYDGAVTKRTSKIGSVNFPITSGAHTLVLTGPGIDNNDPYPLFIP